MKDFDRFTPSTNAVVSPPLNTTLYYWEKNDLQRDIVLLSVEVCNGVTTTGTSIVPPDVIVEDDRQTQ